MENEYINKIKKEDLLDFITICESLNIDFCSSTFENVAINTIKYLSGDKEKRSELRILQELENKWYQSLESGNADYSVYDDPYYLADAWACWRKYSREYLRSIISIKEQIKDVDIIADLGCGIGYTTASLKEIFNCDVYGTNLEGTNQYKVCERIADASQFYLVKSLKHVGLADMVFASEYFEHFERPIEHLTEVLTELRPKHLFFANAFNAKSIGHFNWYKDGFTEYNGKDTSRLFTKTLLLFGYKKVETSFWNNRPNYYKYGE